jgi:hypothetical protein
MVLVVVLVVRVVVEMVVCLAAGSPPLAGVAPQPPGATSRTPAMAASMASVTTTPIGRNRRYPSIVSSCPFP